MTKYSDLGRIMTKDSDLDRILTTDSDLDRILTKDSDLIILFGIFIFEAKKTHNYTLS
jgi:hypothetical protein